MTTIKTAYAPPPIPYRSLDWSAWVDELGEDCSTIGRGETEQEAVADLQEQLDEDEA